MKGGDASRDWTVGLRPVWGRFPIGSKCSALRKGHGLDSGPIICLLFQKVWRRVVEFLWFLCLFKTSVEVVGGPWPSLLFDWEVEYE